MIEVKKAPSYRQCNCCGSNNNIIEIYFRMENKGMTQGTCVALCEDCFEEMMYNAKMVLAYGTCVWGEIYGNDNERMTDDA